MRKDIGNTIKLGEICGRGQPLWLPYELRREHLYICGAMGTGKSKLLESNIRQDILNWSRTGCGLLLIDHHGSLYNNLMRWLARFELARPIIPIDLSSKDWVVGYNVLRKRATDPGVFLPNFVQAMAHVWGVGGTNQTPRFERCASNLLRLLYHNDLTLAEAQILLDYNQRQLREMLIKNCPRDLRAQTGALAIC